MKYILRIKTYFGVIAHVLDNEEDALAKLRHWQKTPCVYGRYSAGSGNGKRSLCGYGSGGKSMKFVKKYCGNKPVWDSEREGNEFLRITQNVNGQYVLHHCYGLAENGITPLRTDIVARTDRLNDCKKKARELYEKPVQVTPRVIAADYSHVRLPYAD